MLSAFHETPVSVPMITHNGFVSVLLKWALESRFYATGPWLTILRFFKVCFDEHQNSSREWLTNHPFSRVPKYFPFLFSNPKLISLFRKKKQPLLPFLRFTAVWNRFVQEQERPFILKYIRGSTVFDAFLMSRHGFYHGLRKIFTVIFKAQNR